MKISKPIFAFAAAWALMATLACANAGTLVAGKPGASSVTPVGQVGQAMHLAASKPQLRSMSLANSEFSPGVVDLLVNVQADRQSGACQFTVNGVSNNPGDGTINTQVFGPLVYTFSVPAVNQKIPLGVMASGKYRIHIAAAALANPACVGAVSADFEVKRKKINIPANITGVVVKDDDYKKSQKTWDVSIQGMSATACSYEIDFKHLPSNKIYGFKTLSVLPMKYEFAFNTDPEYGQYEVTARPSSQPENNVPPCIGTQKTTVRHAAPAMGTLNLMKIDDSAMVVKTAYSADWYPTDATLSPMAPQSLSLDVIFANQSSASAACTYTMTVAKGGAQKAVAYQSGQKPDVLAAIKQGMDWSEGEYVIKLHATALSSSPTVPSCLGSRTHKLKVTSSGAIGQVLHSSQSNLGADVLLHYKIVGAACNYSISVQPSDEAPVVYRLTHQLEGADFIAFNVLKGRTGKEVTDKILGKPFNIHIWASPLDKLGGAGCSGEYVGSKILVPWLNGY